MNTFYVILIILFGIISLTSLVMTIGIFLALKDLKDNTSLILGCNIDND